jgi:hypothetical protein
LQAPGPRGSPHDPQAPAGAASREPPPEDDETANTERSFLTFRPSHVGQRGFAPPRTNSSKRRSQDWHWYSNSGTGGLYEID